jgi:hypothetical protein
MNVFKAIKRVGSVPHKFTFTLQVVALEFSRPITSSSGGGGLVFLWKRGPRSTLSKPIAANAQDRKYSWKDQQYSLVCTLYKQDDQFLDKEATIRFRLDDKDIGIVQMNISKYATAIDQPVEELLFLEKCKDKAATVQILVQAKWIQQVDPE